MVFALVSVFPKKTPHKRVPSTTRTGPHGEREHGRGTPPSDARQILVALLFFCTVPEGRGKAAPRGGRGVARRMGPACSETGAKRFWAWDVWNQVPSILSQTSTSIC